jgi:dihydrofolate reductase
MKKIIIAAMSPGRVMGVGGTLPWHIPGDLKHFKRTTNGSPMLMGRKTFDSFPSPLPNRHHIVVTRNPAAYTNSSQVSFVSSIEEGYGVASWLSETLFIIGGAEIYRQTIADADEMVLTHVEEEFVGDTFFPEWRDDNWVTASQERPEESKIPYCVRRYRRG